MKLVPGSRERSTSVLTPPTLSSTPPLPPAAIDTARPCSTPARPPPPPLVPVPRRRIVKPLFSAGQPDKRREDAFLFSSFFFSFLLLLVFPLLVLVTGSADGFPSPGKCCSFGDGDVTREPSRDSKTCGRNFFSIGIEEEVNSICVCYRSCNGYTVYCSMESWKRVFRSFKTSN